MQATRYHICRVSQGVSSVSERKKVMFLGKMSEFHLGFPTVPTALTS